MKYKFIVSFVFAALAVSLLSAQETNKTGTVSVIKDFSGKTTAIKLIVKDYDIKLDETSKQLMIYMDGERTTVAGALCDENGKCFVILDPQARGKTGTTSSAIPQGAVPFKETGMISITKDAAGQISSIKLIVESYSIKLDENAKRLESMNGQKVRVTHDASYEMGLLPVTEIELVEDAVPPVSDK